MVTSFLFQWTNVHCLVILGFPFYESQRQADNAYLLKEPKQEDKKADLLKRMRPAERAALMEEGKYYKKIEGY